MITEIEQATQRGALMPSTSSHLSSWLKCSTLPTWARTSIEELITAQAWSELNDRFYQQIAFGTGGMRGRTIGRHIAPTETGTPGAHGTPTHAAVGTNMMNDFNVIKATIGLYRYTEGYLKSQPGRYGKPRIVIAHDVRHFSRRFCELVASTFSRLGGEAFIFGGPRSTPQLSFSVRYLKATCGVVITASHNPPHDNGFKAYFDDGAQVVSPHAEAIVGAVQALTLEETIPHLDIELSQVITLDDEADAAYLQALMDNIIDGETIAKASPKVVFTPIHGTGSTAALPALKSLGVAVVTVPEQEIQHPGFPTVSSPNPENGEALALAMAKADAVGADIVLATDPDADRLGVAVRNPAGKLVLLTGNQIGSLLAEYRILTLQEADIINSENAGQFSLIKTFVTTPLQEAIAKHYGLKLINTLTGFKFIGEKLNDYEQQMKAGLMEEEGMAVDYDRCEQGARLDLQKDYGTAYVFGGEESYGYLGSDLVRDKDAHGAALMFIEMASWCTHQRITIPEFLDHLYLEYGYYQESLINVVYEGATGAQKIRSILDSYRTQAPKYLGSFTVKGIQDFGRDTIEDADGKEIPKQDLFIVSLSNGYRYAVRGSGTEPKIKFYLFAHEEVDGPDSLADVKSHTDQTLKALADAIKADADRRAKG